MSAVFLSHSSKDDALAAQARATLAALGHRSVFLDFDPVDGIPGGRNWERELYAMLRQAHAVVVLCSRHSMQSRWCFAEITHARALGKYVIPVRLDDSPVESLLADTQAIDARTNWDDAFARVHRALAKAGLDAADAFDWDPRRAPYPGLLALQEADAAVFFGRDREVRDALDLLNRSRRFGGARLIVVEGGSGCGKSSLVRAGVVPRLKRDTDSWLVLEPFRPRDAPLDELSLVFADALTACGDPREWRTVLGQIDSRGGTALIGLCESLRRAARRRDATVLLVVDQLEEVLGAAAGPVSAALFTLLRTALAVDPSPLIVLATLRAEYLAEVHSHPALLGFPIETISVRPLGADGLAQVILGPAEVAGVRLQQGLVELMVADTQTGDALPLLAFTLRELYERHGGDGVLTIEDYRAGLGGLEGSVARAAESVYQAARLDAESPDGAALRAAFAGMARVDDSGQFVRRSIRAAPLAPRVRALLERFRAARLLNVRDVNGELMIEVAHEAIFRSWNRMAAWLAQEREFLQWRQQISQYVRDWERSGRDPGTLLRGGPLLAAERWATERPEHLDGVEVELIAASRTDQRLREEELRRLYDTAEVQRRAAVARGLTAQAALLQARDADLLQASVLLAAEAVKRAPSIESDQVLRASVALLPVPGPRWFHRGMVTTIDFSRDGAWVAWGGGNDAQLQQVRPPHRSVKLPHPSVLEAVAFSPDGRTLATACWDGHARVWDVDSARELLRLGHGGGDTHVQQVRYSYRGTYLGSYARNLHIPTSGEGDDAPAVGRVALVWDSLTGAEVARVVHDGSIDALAFSPADDVLATASYDGSARLWDAVTGAQVLRVDHGCPTTAVAFSPDGRLFASAADDGEVRVWDRTTDREIARVFHEGRADLCRFSPDGRLLATGGADRTARVWALDSGREIMRVSHPDHVWRLAFSPDGASLATITANRLSARVWSVASGRETARAIHEGIVNEVAFSPDGDHLVTCSGHLQDGYLVDPGVALWGLRSGDADSELRGGGDIAFSSDGEHFAYCTDAGMIVLAVDSARQVSQLEVPGGVHALAFHPRSRTIAVAGRAEPRLFDVDTGSTHSLSFSDWNGFTRALAFSPDGGRLAVATTAHTVHVVDLASSREIGRIAHQDFVTALRFENAGTHFVTASGPSVRIWDASTLTESASITLEGDASDAVFSPDGRFLATFGLSGPIRLLDCERGVELPPLHHKEFARYVAWSPDGRTLASAGNDGVRLWRIPEGTLWTMLVRNVPPRGLAFLPDGSHLVAALNDRTLRFFDLSRLEEAARITHEADLSTLAVCPDGRRVAASGDGTTSVWLWRRDDLLTAGLCRATRNLTIDEWQQNLDEPYAKVCDRLPAHESVIRKALELLDEGQVAPGRALLEQAVRVDDGEIGDLARDILTKLDRRQAAAPPPGAAET